MHYRRKSGTAVNKHRQVEAGDEGGEEATEEARREVYSAVKRRKICSAACGSVAIDVLIAINDISSHDSHSAEQAK